MATNPENAPGGNASTNSCPVMSPTDGITPSFVITTDTPTRTNSNHNNNEQLSTHRGDTMEESGDDEKLTFIPNSESTSLKCEKKHSKSFPSSSSTNNSLDRSDIRRTPRPNPDPDGGLSPRVTSSLGVPSFLGRSKGMSDTMHSRDVESICTAHSDLRSEKVEPGAFWWTHPKIKEHWKVFVFAFALLVIGITLIVLGIVGTALPDLGFQSYVFFIGGLLCFIPGAYHVVFVYCAVKGRSGYSLYQLPFFN